jgi:hypothetical protein
MGSRGARHPFNGLANDAPSASSRGPAASRWYYRFTPFIAQVRSEFMPTQPGFLTNFWTGWFDARIGIGGSLPLVWAGRRDGALFRPGPPAFAEGRLRPALRRNPLCLRRAGTAPPPRWSPSRPVRRPWKTECWNPGDTRPLGKRFRDNSSLDLPRSGAQIGEKSRLPAREGRRLFPEGRRGCGSRPFSSSHTRPPRLSPGSFRATSAFLVCCAPLPQGPDRQKNVFSEV